MNPKDSTADDERITVSMVAEMLEQQRTVFKDMMELLEKNFKGLITWYLYLFQMLKGS